MIQAPLLCDFPASLTAAVQGPLIEASFTHKRDDDVFAEMQQQSKDILAQGS